ncbi:MAG: DUF5018 domain-containing protein [Spirochaetaceae bacterium]|jgi:hypothetical protein|nr:DUF5018 domain-containing protein [Spirochaetaceae bacterium]
MKNNKKAPFRSEGKARNPLWRRPFQSILIVALGALAFGGCNAFSEDAGLRANKETTWIRLVPESLYTVDDGTAMATLTLDFSRVIDELEDNPSEEKLAALITFDYEYYPTGTPDSRKLKPVKVVKLAEAIYILTVKNIPSNGGIAQLTVHKSTITPPTRLWSLNGQALPDEDVTAALLDFRFERGKNPSLTAEAIGGIDQRQGTVFVVVPPGTPLSPLTPSIITNLGNTYTPSSQSDFVGSVPYRVTADRTLDEKDYEVRVIQQTQSSARIYVFGFTKEENAAFLTSSLSGVINEAAKTITVTAPYGTDLRALKPAITHSGARISPANLAVRDFSNPLTYTVSPISGADVDYVVNVYEGTDPNLSNLFEITWNPQGEPKDTSGYSGGVVEKALQWLNDTTANGGTLNGRQFEIRLDADAALGPQTLGGAASDDGAAYPNIKGKNLFNVGITVKSRDGSTRRTLSLSAPGSMFKLASGAYIDMAVDSVILKGLSAGHTVLNSPATVPIEIPESSPSMDNDKSLVYVGQGSAFELLGSAELTGNWNAATSEPAGHGGAVQLVGGMFRMTGADTSVHNNYAALSGGGIWSIGEGVPAQLIMAGENAAVSFNAIGATGDGGGGGIMADGDSSDTTKATYFTMSGNNAKINGNQGRSGGGIRLYGKGSTGLMSGANAAISDNTTADGGGGGVYNTGNGQFTMSGAGAQIRNNTASDDGGGILCVNGDFTMAGGEVSGNECPSALIQIGISGGTHKFANGVHGVVYITGSSGGDPNDLDLPSGGDFATSNWYWHQTLDTVIKVLP